MLGVPIPQHYQRRTTNHEDGRRRTATADADRRRRYSAKSPMPSIFKWWAKRQAWTLILTLALPFVCWGFSAFEKAHAHGHGEHGGEHGHGAAGAEGHGGHAEGHGGHEAVAGHGADAEAAAHGGDAIFTFTHNLHDATTSFAASHPEAAAHRRLSAHGAEEEGGHGEEEGEEEEEGGCYDDPHYKWYGPDPTSDSRTCQDLTPLIGSADCDAEHNAETVAFYCPLTCGTCKKPHWYHHVQRTASAVHHAAHAAVHHAAHHVEGFVEAQAQLSIIIVLVIFTLIFENGKEVVEEKFRKYRPVLERIWGELTVLGFLALVTFILLQSEATHHTGTRSPSAKQAITLRRLSVSPPGAAAHLRGGLRGRRAPRAHVREDPLRALLRARPLPHVGPLAARLRRKARADPRRARDADHLLRPARKGEGRLRGPLR